MPPNDFSNSRRKRQKLNISEAFPDIADADAVAARDDYSDKPSTTMLTDDDGCGANVCCEYRPTVTIYIGDKEQRIPQSDSLPHIWGTGLDSPCHACGRGFVQEADPTIRTIGFETSQSAQPSVVDFTPAPLAPHPIRIFYRHFSCIQANSIDYVPVSHAWHELVSCAQMERRTNAEVAGLVYQTPVLSLLALTKKHGPTEIWHDYLSVLQWQRNVQRQLLLKIPTIYSFPGTMMIHLDDVQEKHPSNIRTNSSYSDSRRVCLPPPTRDGLSACGLLWSTCKAKRWQFLLRTSYAITMLGLILLNLMTR